MIITGEYQHRLILQIIAKVLKQIKQMTKVTMSMAKKKFGMSIHLNQKMKKLDFIIHHQDKTVMVF